MNETLFQIRCPSCETTFEVTDPELVGQIVACPKCGGMILVEAPSERNEPEEIKEESNAQEEVDAPVLSKIESAPEESEPIVTPPIVESDEEEPPLSDASKSIRRSRVILMLSGVLCALLCFLLVRPFLSRDVEVEEPQEIEAESSVVPSQEPLVTPGELAEEETDVANLVNPNDLTNEIGVFGDANTEDASTSDEIEGNAQEESTDEPALDSESVDEQTSIDSNAETLDAESSGVDETNETTVETEPGVEDEEGVATDEEFDSDEALPTEFDEAEFEKANQNASEEESEPDEEEDLGAVASTTEVGLQTALPTLKNEPQKIDVEARMKLPIRAITFPTSPAATLRLLSEYSGVPFELDLARFESIRSSFDATLDLTLENVDVEGALNAVAKELKWNVVKEEGKIVVEPLDAGDATLIEERFDVSDLLGAKLDSFVEVGAESASDGAPTSEERLIRLIETLVSPDSWETRGGAGRVSFADGSLVVFQDAQNRRCVSTLLERLRALRGLEAKDASIANSLIPETLGWERLEQKTTLNLLKSTPLQQALEILERSQKFLILWDDATLNESGYGRDATIAANFDSETLERVLFDLLDPLKFSYVILGENLILITTKEKASNYQTFEICLYSESETRKTLEEASALSDEMKNAIGVKAWEQPGVALWLDLETNCWLIRQSQPIQREIRRWVGGRTENTKKTEKQSGAPN